MSKRERLAIRVADLKYIILFMIFVVITGLCFMQSCKSANNAFLARFTPEGRLIWAKYASGNNHVSSRAIAKMKDESVIITGSFGRFKKYGGSIIFNKGGTNEDVLLSEGNGDVFIARYYKDGSLVWVKQVGGDGDSEGRSISILSDNSFIITGTFEGKAIFGKGSFNTTTLKSSGNRDIFIARYDSEGNLIWAKAAGGSRDSACDSIKVLSDNSIIVTGWFRGDFAFARGEPDEITFYGESLFICRYKQDGTLLWAKHAKGPIRVSGVGLKSTPEGRVKIDRL